MRRASLVFACALFVAAANLVAADPAQPVPSGKNAFETGLVDPFLSSYFLRYLLRVSPQDELSIGFSYTGRTNALFGAAYPGSFQFFAPSLGYRRYLWRAMYAEYVLFPGLAIYNDTGAAASYSSFELWNEFHVGYRFEMQVGRIWLTISPEVIAAFPDIRSNEPRSFRTVDEASPAFGWPGFSILPNILVGIAF